MKKIILQLLALGLILGNTAYASDLSSWAETDYEAVSSHGILTYDVVSGKLNAEITRGEVCAMLVNMYKHMTITQIPEIENPFEDTDDETIVAAYSAGIVSGKSENYFDTEGKITRQEFAKMILNLLSATGYEFEVEEDIIDEILESFEDDKQIADWAKKAVAISVKAGIITGTTKTTVSPLGNATREQAICMVNRVYNKFVENKKSYEVPSLQNHEPGAMGDIKFIWDEIAGAKKYTFIIKDAESELMEMFDTTVPNATVYGDAYMPGLYTVIIGAENKDGAYAYSKPADVEFKEFSYPAFSYMDSDLSEKEQRVFPNGQPFQTADEAKGYMIEVSVPVWKLKSNGEKYSSTMYLTVNQALAEDVVSIFTEIYNSPEQFPIKDVGGYYWRNTASGNLSQHSYGTCIDINANENYYVRPDGTPIVGNYWKPYEDPYSIPEDGIVVATFAKYGWEWGGNCWGDSYAKDYMHFTYLGK